MATGNIVKVWRDPVNTYIAVSVTEDTGEVIEYVAHIPTSSLTGLTSAQQRAALAAAVKAVRDSQQTPVVSVALTGQVAL